jgi:hypothetical protein
MSCIIAFRHPTHIVMACDSIGTRADDFGLHRTEGSVKLQQADRWTLALCGWSGLPDEGINVNDVFASAVTGTTRLLDALSFAQRAYRKTLRPALVAASRHAGFGQLFQPGSPIFELFIAGFERETPVLGIYAVQLDDARIWRDTEMWATAPGRLGNGVVAGPSGSCRATRTPLVGCSKSRPTPRRIASGHRSTS